MHADHSGHVIYKDGYAIKLRREFEWDAGIGPDARERDTADSAIAAILELTRELIEPLEFGITKSVLYEQDSCWFDRESPLDESHWYLKLPLREASPAWTNAIVVDAARIDGAAMRAAVETLLTTPCGLEPGQWPSWTEIYLYENLARVPDDSLPGPGGHLIVDDHDNRHDDLRVPLHELRDAVWTGSPGLGHWSPIAVRLNRDLFSGSFDGVHYTSVVLTVDVHWSLWWEPGSAGRRVLDRAMDALRRAGRQESD
ncbi:hypothetical protein ABZ319_34550 [Nocardia sp. NPDC005978]|uniref:hypothetical protein n=1 Tax=Nocardia sp. NPDC005978 TaxID=3156725 RepID=UPI0033AEBD03